MHTYHMLSCAEYQVSYLYAGWSKTARVATLVTRSRQSGGRRRASGPLTLRGVDSKMSSLAPSLKPRSLSFAALLLGAVCV